MLNCPWIETSPPVVHLVEDDASVRRATARLLRAAGYLVRTYADGTEFLAASAKGPGCVVLDLQLPGLSGLEIQRCLSKTDEALPVVFLSGHAGVSESVEAMKCGAVDFLTKSVNARILLQAVATALTRDQEARSRREHLNVLRTRYERLTSREREVLAHLVSGQLNKQIGFDLGISEQTTKIHRHRVLQKMHADSIASLVRMADDLQIAPAGSPR
jgi:FixJ family two-component response regulator